MADALYDLYSQDLLTGTAPTVTSDQIDLRGMTSASYTFGAAHAIGSITQYAGANYADKALTAGNSTASSAGVWDNTDDQTFASLGYSTGDLDQLALFFNTTVDVPMVYLDTFTGVTPNGGDVTVQWNASGILSY